MKELLPGMDVEDCTAAEAHVHVHGGSHGYKAGVLQSSSLSSRLLQHASSTDASPPPLVCGCGDRQESALHCITPYPMPCTACSFRKCPSPMLCCSDKTYWLLTVRADLPRTSCSFAESIVGYLLFCTFDLWACWVLPAMLLTSQSQKLWCSTS